MGYFIRVYGTERVILLGFLVLSVSCNLKTTKGKLEHSIMVPNENDGIGITQVANKVLILYCVWVMSKNKNLKFIENKMGRVTELRRRRLIYDLGTVYSIVLLYCI